MTTDNAEHVAFLFPGNNSSYTEELAALKGHPMADRFLEAAISLHRSSVGEFTSPQGKEVYDSLLIHALSCAICDIYKSKGIRPAVVSGYSLGMYPSLYCAGVCSFETSLKMLMDTLLCTRDFFAAQKEEFGMGAIIGLSEEELVGQVFPSLSGRLEIASFNGTRSFVVVGPRQPVMMCLQKSETIGAFRAVPLCTPHGYHSRMLGKAAQALPVAWRDFQFKEPECTILSPADDEPVHREKIADAMVTNLASPLRWATLVSSLPDRYQVVHAYETGPGDTLTRMSRHITKRLKMIPFSVSSGGQ